MKNLGLIILAFLFAFCSGKNEEPIAVAYKNKLYLSDIASYFNENINSDDSVKLLKRVVNQWLAQQVKLNEAEKLKINKDKINLLVDDYKNQLVISSMLEEFVLQNLDTSVNEKEMLDYFVKNKEHFLLSKNILKLIFIKVNPDYKDLNNLKKLVKRGSFRDKEDLMEFCVASGSNCFLDDNVWLDFNEVIKEIPIKTYDAENYLQNNRYVEVKDGNYLYLVNIKDFKIKNSTSEFDFEKENIKKVLLNSRKLNLIKKFEEDLISQAYKENLIESNVND